MLDINEDEFFLARKTVYTENLIIEKETTFVFSEGAAFEKCFLCKSITFVVLFFLELFFNQTI